MLSESYEEEQEELRQKIATLENEIQNHEDQMESVDKSSGHRVQDVDISYNYIGILPAN